MVVEVTNELLLSSKVSLCVGRVARGTKGWLVYYGAYSGGSQTSAAAQWQQVRPQRETQAVGC